MIWLVFCFFCSDIMMRDNLFEVVTTSRTFYIQVGGFLQSILIHALKHCRAPWLLACLSTVGLHSHYFNILIFTPNCLTLLSLSLILSFSFMSPLGRQSRGDAQLDQGCLRGHCGPAGAWEVCCYSMYLVLQYNTIPPQYGFKSFRGDLSQDLKCRCGKGKWLETWLNLACAELENLSEWYEEAMTMTKTYLCCFTHVIILIILCSFLLSPAHISLQAAEMQWKLFL